AKTSKTANAFTKPSRNHRGAPKQVGAHAKREGLGVRILELAADKFEIRSQLLGALPLDPSPQLLAPRSSDSRFPTPFLKPQDSSLGSQNAPASVELILVPHRTLLQRDSQILNGDHVASIAGQRTETDLEAAAKAVLCQANDDGVEDIVIIRISELGNLNP